MSAWPVTDQQVYAWMHFVFGGGRGDVDPEVLCALHTLCTTCCQAVDDDVWYDGGMLEVLIGPCAAQRLLQALMQAEMLEPEEASQGGWLTIRGEALRTYLLSQTRTTLLSRMRRAVEAGLPSCSPRRCACPGADEYQGCHNNPLWTPEWRGVGYHVHL